MIKVNNILKEIMLNLKSINGQMTTQKKAAITLSIRGKQELERQFDLVRPDCGEMSP